MMFKLQFSLFIKTIEWYKNAIGGIFNIYKYIIKWRPQHQYKVIFTLNVESFLSDTEGIHWVKEHVLTSETLPGNFQ